MESWESEEEGKEEEEKEEEEEEEEEVPGPISRDAFSSNGKIGGNDLEEDEH